MNRASTVAIFIQGSPATENSSQGPRGDMGFIRGEEAKM